MFSFPKYSKDWNEISEKVKLRDGYTCRRCGRKGVKAGGTAILHAHHVISKSKGGRDTPSNLVTYCDRCHTSEHPHMNFKKKKKKIIFY